MSTSITSTPVDHTQFPNTTIKQLQHIPGKKGFPILGKTPQLFNNFYGTIQKHHDRYGTLSKIGLGFESGLLVLGPENSKAVLLDREKNFSSQMGYADVTGLWFGGSIMFLDFNEHRIHRRAFQTAFKSDAMQGYSEGINSIIEKSLTPWKNQTEIKFMPFMKQLLINIGAQIFYNIDDIGDDAKKMSDAFLLILEKGMMSLVKKDIPPLNFHYGMKGKRFIVNYLASLIEERRQGNGKDFMSYLVKEKRDDGTYFTDEELVGNLAFLFFAAYDTTSAALSHLIMHLAADQELQDKLRQQSRDLNKPIATFEDLDKLPEIELAFQEALRLYPSASVLMRRTINECELEGYRVPANTILFQIPGFNHRMPEYWSHPEQFDPQRFNTERQEFKKHPFQYIPFGGGAHKCIGMNFAQMNAKLFMHQVLMSYRFTLKPGYKINSQILPTPCPKGGLPLIIEKL